MPVLVARVCRNAEIPEGVRGAIIADAPPKPNLITRRRRKRAIVWNYYPEGPTTDQMQGLRVEDLLSAPAGTYRVTKGTMQDLEQLVKGVEQ